MHNRRITMRKIKEVLRLAYACGLSLEQIARAQNLSKCVVAKFVKRATAASIDGTTTQTLDEADLVARVKPSNDTPQQSTDPYPCRYLLTIRSRSVSSANCACRSHLCGGRGDVNLNRAGFTFTACDQSW